LGLGIAKEEKGIGVIAGAGNANEELGPFRDNCQRNAPKY